MVTVGLAYGCGAASEEERVVGGTGGDRGAAEEPARSPGAEGDTSGESGRDLPSRTPPPPTMQSRENPSDRSTSLGRVCWTEREITKSIVDLAGTTMPGHGSEAEIRKTVRQTRALILSIEDHLGSREGLPEEAAEFRQEFIEAGEEAEEIVKGLSEDSSEEEREEAAHKLANLFALDHYEGVDDYVKAIEEDRSSCPELGG